MFYPLHSFEILYVDMVSVPLVNILSQLLLGVILGEVREFFPFLPVRY